MTGLLQHFSTSLRLYFRNRMALLYGYLFPAIFLGAFWILYRFESIPLLRHMGELLTVSALGGACFGLPTTIVSERERGVWRRYRLAPIPASSLVASTVTARYVLLLTAGLVQLLLAMATGLPMPSRPFDLLVAFTFVSFAFLGLGLVMAMLADTVPAVQALGQCIFLPMLIVGGVAVPLGALPDWAQHVSAFFPGRYAVELLQASVTGDGLGAARFNLLALFIIGAAGCVAGGKLFRWDAQQRFAAADGKAWVGVALAAWIAVGLAAESRGRIGTRPSQAAATGTTAAPASIASVVQPSQPGAAAAPPVAVAPAPERRTPVDTARISLPKTTQPAPPKTAPAAPMPPMPASWEAVTTADIERDLVFDRLPPDSGVVTPIAPMDEEPDPEVMEMLEYLRRQLPDWKPGKVSDPVQRVRNFLFVAAVPDVFQMPLERFTAWVVYERLEQDVPKDTLIKVLYWIALHPEGGDDAALDDLYTLRIGNGPSDAAQARERMAVYGVKLLGRLLGKIPTT